MRYILQLSTGSFSRSELKAEEAAETLEYCMQVLDVEKVIFGWNANAALNRQISHVLDGYAVEKYLWLPVFAEIQGRDGVHLNRKLTEEREAGFQVCEGDAFDFVCQSSRENREYALEVFDRLTEGCRMDGVFLDRIRYASAAAGVGALYGCWCPRCREIYEKNGVDTGRIMAMAGTGGVERFMPVALEQGVYRYEDKDIDRLMACKRQIISSQVAALCDRFHSRGLKVGADTFAPCVADFVGQDICALAGKTDFIKPMIYLRTDAPAGIPFERRALGEEIRKETDRLWGGDTGSMEGVIRQIREIKNAADKVAPGVDANRIEGICGADSAYVKAFLRQLAEAGVARAVLSWDIMRIAKDTIKAIADVISVSGSGDGMAV